MTLFEQAEARFGSAHQQDPNEVSCDGESLPWSVLYHRRLAHWVDRLSSESSEAMRLAARCQHIRRWTIPRSNFPDGVTGYKKWRSSLAQFHADQAGEVLSDVGYDDSTIARVRAFLIKKALKNDVEVQLFEDAICLTFIENQLDVFAAKHESDKIVEIISKTWAKMSEAGHAAVHELLPQIPSASRALLERALSGGPRPARRSSE